MHSNSDPTLTLSFLQVVTSSHFKAEGGSWEADHRLLAWPHQLNIARLHTQLQEDSQVDTRVLNNYEIISNLCALCVNILGKHCDEICSVISTVNPVRVAIRLTVLLTLVILMNKSRVFLTGPYLYILKNCDIIVKDEFTNISKPPPHS